MSIPLVYDSCLSDESLDSAITDYLRVTQENEKNQRELDTHNADQQIKADAAAAAGEPYEWEHKEIEKIDCQIFNSVEKKFVVCIDTMGQDREIPDEHRREVLKTIKIFIEQWERAETECLTHDRDTRIELMSRDTQIESDLQEKVTEIINKAVEDLLAIE